MTNDFKNILIVRTDRLGDVVLTVPTIAAVRQAFPRARISVLLAPATKDLVDGNPFVDQVLVYDRNGKDKGFWNYWKFVHNLRRKRFDLAFVFHTKKRINMLCWLAGILVRTGYKNEKFGFLLNRPVKDTRPQGFQHEVEYCLDVVRQFDPNLGPAQFYFPVRRESEAWVDRFFRDHKIGPMDRIIAIHPGASCASKCWSPERFAEVIKGIESNPSFKTVIVGGIDILGINHAINDYLKRPALSVVGKTTVSQLVSLLKRSSVVISNDSGPMHLGSALGRPVIAIFGRNIAGLNPSRWGPLSPQSVVLHKDVGCIVCLAHNCQIDFKCLKALEPQEVLRAFDSISSLW